MSTIRETRQYLYLLTHLDFFICSFSKHEKLSLAELERYQDILSWSCLAANKNLKWNTVLIDRFKDRLFEFPVDEYFHHNENLPFDVAFINRYYNYWDWELLAENERIKENIKLQEHFQKELAPYTDSFDLPQREILEPRVFISETIFDPTDIERNIKLNSAALSRNRNLPWSEELIAQFSDRWIWQVLSYNKAIPWSLSLILRFKEYWHPPTLVLNEAIPFTIEMLWALDDYWDSSMLEINPKPWVQVFEDFHNKPNVVYELLEGILNLETN
jgi:hypothetical protein